MVKNLSNLDQGYTQRCERELRKKCVPLRNNWTPVDEALFSQKTLFDIPTEKAEKLRYNAIKYAFQYHYSKSLFYRRFCKELHVKPDDIKQQLDFLKIPLISDLFFKNYPSGSAFLEWINDIFVGDFPEVDIKSHRPSFDDIIDALQGYDITVVFSTGTGGRFSFIPKDQLTWARQMYAYARIFEMLPFVPSPKDSIGIWLGPNPRKTHLFIGRVATFALEVFDESKIHFGIDRELTTDLVRILMGRTSGVKEQLKAGVIRPAILLMENKMIKRFMEILANCEKSKNKVVISGPPFLIDVLLSRIERSEIQFSFHDGMMITGGGWKTYGSKGLQEKSFLKRVEQILGIPNNRCRDVYSMVECNAATISCEGGYKHVPHSVLYPMVLDKESKPLGYGEYGRFAFLDPLANSYPGFVMTGDKVKLLEHCPACDRPGPVVDKKISRMTDVEIRGCGEIMARMFSREIDK